MTIPMSIYKYINLKEVTLYVLFVLKKKDCM